MWMRFSYKIWISTFVFLMALSCAKKQGSEAPKGKSTEQKVVDEKKQPTDASPVSAVPDPKPEKKPQFQLSENEEISTLVSSLVNPRKGAAVLRALSERSKSGDRAWVKEALATLRRALKHPKPNVRSQSGQILVLFSDKSRKKIEKQTIKALSDAMVSDRDGDVRAVIAAAAAKTKDKSFSSALVRILDRDDSAAARAAAAKSLGALKIKSATVPLIRALDDGAVKVRLNAINSLRKLKAKQAVNRLADLLEDENQMVRSRAHKALKDITGKRHAAQRNLWR